MKGCNGCFMTMKMLNIEYVPIEMGKRCIKLKRLRLGIWNVVHREFLKYIHLSTVIYSRCKHTRDLKASPT